MFKTNDNAYFRYYKNDENLWQIIYQILVVYFEDDCVDELTNDPVLIAILAKKALASGPTLSRFFNRKDETTLGQFYKLMRRFHKVVYSIKKPEMILLDVNSISYEIAYGELMYQTGSWEYSCRVVCKVEKPVIANRLQIHALEYNIFNWFKRLVLPANMCKQLMDTIRLKLLKVAARAVRSARYITFKHCSSCPYKTEFYEILVNIGNLRSKLE